VGGREGTALRTARDKVEDYLALFAFAELEKLAVFDDAARDLWSALPRTTEQCDVA
jgi:hypothetical protein